MIWNSHMASSRIPRYHSCMAADRDSSTDPRDWAGLGAQRGLGHRAKAKKGLKMHFKPHPSPYPYPHSNPGTTQLLANAAVP